MSESESTKIEASEELSEDVVDNFVKTENSNQEQVKEGPITTDEFRSKVQNGLGSELGIDTNFEEQRDDYAVSLEERLSELEEDDKLLYKTFEAEFLTDNFAECLESGYINVDQGQFSDLLNFSSNEDIKRVDLVDKAEKSRNQWDSQAYRIKTSSNTYFVEEREVRSKTDDMISQTKDLILSREEDAESYEDLLEQEYGISVDSAMNQDADKVL